MCRFREVVFLFWLQLLLTGIFPAGSALGEKVGDTPMDQVETVVLTGQISVKGSEPNTILVLSVHDEETDKHTDYEVVGPYRPEIALRHQQHTLKVEALLVSPAQGAGFPARIDVLCYKVVGKGSVHIRQQDAHRDSQRDHRSRFVPDSRRDAERNGTSQT